MEAETVKAITKKDVFVIMVRYAGNYWSASGTYNTLDAAQINTNIMGIEAWRIVCVKDLPIDVKNGEA